MIKTIEDIIDLALEVVVEWECDDRRTIRISKLRKLLDGQYLNMELSTDDFFEADLTEEGNGQ